MVADKEMAKSTRAIDAKLTQQRGPFMWSWTFMIVNLVYYYVNKAPTGALLAGLEGIMPHFVS